MIPDKRWFPSSLQERAAWYRNFSAKMQTMGLSLGFTAPELVSLDEDAQTFSTLAAATLTLDTYVDGIRLFRKTISEGNIGDPPMTCPADISITMPFDPPTGMFERLDAMVKRLRTFHLYTEEIGAQLGIIPSGNGGGTNVPVDEQAPVLKASVDPGHVIEVKFTRGESEGVYIEKNVNNAGWTFADKVFKSPAVFAVPGDGIPQGVQLRARFIENNLPVGDWSSVVTVQTIP